MGIGLECARESFLGKSSPAALGSKTGQNQLSNGQPPERSYRELPRATKFHVDEHLYNAGKNQLLWTPSHVGTQQRNLEPRRRVNCSSGTCGLQVIQIDDC